MRYLQSYLDKEEINIDDVIKIVNSQSFVLKDMYHHKVYLDAIREYSNYNYELYRRGKIDVYVCSKTMEIIKAIIDTVTTSNVDWFIGVIGHNGSGKSTFSYSFIDAYCKLLGFDTREAVRRNTIYDEEDFFEYLSNANDKRPLEPVFLDEGANILFNRESMSKNRKWIMKFINVMRFLNKIVIITSLQAKMLDINIRNQRIKSIIYIDQSFDLETTTRMAYYYEGDDIQRFYKYELGDGSLPDTDLVLQFSENIQIADEVLKIKKSYSRNLANQAKIELLKIKMKKLEDIIELRKKMSTVEKYGIEIDENIKAEIEKIINDTSEEVNRIKIGGANDTNNI